MITATRRLVLIAGVALGAAACGSSSTSSVPASTSATSSGSQQVSSTTASVSAASSSVSTTSTAAVQTPASAAMAPASPIATGSTSLGTVLTDTHGLTLYYFTPERGTHVVCTGACASTWPPLRVSTAGAQSLPAGVSGTLATVNRPDGTVQVTFNGWPLYHFVRDTAPGSVRGQGIAGMWFVAKPGLAP